jgi:hypothetical protein
MFNVDEIIVQDGVYGTRKNNGQFTSLSNCTVRFKNAVDAGDMCGFLGVVTHKDGNER